MVKQGKHILKEKTMRRLLSQSLHPHPALLSFFSCIFITPFPLRDGQEALWLHISLTLWCAWAVPPYPQCWWYLPNLHSFHTQKYNLAVFLGIPTKRLRLPDDPSFCTYNHFNHHTTTNNSHNFHPHHQIFIILISIITINTLPLASSHHYIITIRTIILILILFGCLASLAPMVIPDS